MAKSIHSQRHSAFRALLREARQDRSLTQAALAAMLGRDQSFVAKYEAGERRIDVIEFMDLCQALGVDPATILVRLTTGVGPGGPSRPKARKGNPGRSRIKG